MCQKARLIVQRADDSVTPSETSGSRAGAPTATTSASTTVRTARGDVVDLNHIQNMLARNPEIAEVVSTTPAFHLYLARTAGLPLEAAFTTHRPLKAIVVSVQADFQAWWM